MPFNLRRYSQLLLTKPAEDSAAPVAEAPSAPEPPKPPSGPQKGSGPGSPTVFGKKRIKDRGIRWEEQYGENSDDLKKRLDAMIGPGAYFRFVGHDYTTDGDYFVVVGPAITEDEKKKFFAGIKRLPDDPTKTVYAPSGEYFNSNHAALTYAKDKWGVEFPQGTPQYNEAVLQNVKIPRHVKG